MKFNPLDIAIIVIIIMFMASGYRNGLVKSLFKLFSTVISLVLAFSFYPAVSKALKQNEKFYNAIVEKVSKAVDIESLVEAKLASQAPQNELFEKLKLPDFMVNKLILNNTPTMYKILKVDTIEEFVARYVTDIIINVIALIIVFVLISLALSVIAGSLDIIARLPVINTFNKFGGLGVGLAQGTVFIWIATIIAMLLLSTEQLGQFYLLIKQSDIASFFYDTNILLHMLL